MKEAEIIYNILKRFSQMKSINGKFLYSFRSISITGTKKYPIFLDGTQINDIEEYKNFIEVGINKGQLMSQNQHYSQIFNNGGWDIEILGEKINGKPPNSNQKEFLLEAKGGAPNDSNRSLYILRALGQAIFIHQVINSSNNNICVAFPKSWHDDYIHLVEKPNFRKLMKVFGRNQLCRNLKPFLKDGLSENEIKKVKDLIKNALPFDTYYIRVFFVDKDGNVEIYQWNGKTRAKILWQRKNTNN